MGYSAWGLQESCKGRSELVRKNKKKRIGGRIGIKGGDGGGRLLWAVRCRQELQAWCKSTPKRRGTG